MKLATLQKTGGIAVITGGILLAVYAICFFTLLPFKTLRSDYLSAIMLPQWVPVALCAFVALIALMFGFTAVYSRIYSKTGWVGFLGYVLVEFAYLHQASKVTWEFCMYPVIANNASASVLFSQFILPHDHGVVLFRLFGTIAIFLGTTLFSLSIFISKVIPKSAGVMIFCGAVLYGLGPMLSTAAAMTGIIIFALGCTQTGISLFRSTDK